MRIAGVWFPSPEMSTLSSSPMFVMEYLFVIGRKRIPCENTNPNCQIPSCALERRYRLLLSTYSIRFEGIV